MKDNISALIKYNRTRTNTSHLKPREFKTRIQKLGILVLIMIIAPLLAAIYGAAHDQISYTISPEYFTKFKFSQFGLESHWFGGIRNTVAVIGVMATWWFGLITGFIQGVVGLIHNRPKTMFMNAFKSLLITLLTTLIIGVLGLFYGIYFSLANPEGWYFPDHLLDKKSFVGVGWMHNFGYIGGLGGMILGVIFQFRKKLTQPPSRI